MSRSIRVVCRFRAEKAVDHKGDEDPFDVWEFFPENATVKIKDKSFTYDALLVECQQDEMYEKVGRETIAEYMKGYNTTIFAYGQSGSGKTFSMVGPDEINEQLANDFTNIPIEIQNLFGVIPRAVLQIFESINELVVQGYECKVECSYVEIYMEEITCLLNLQEKLKIKEYPEGGIEVEGKKKVICKTPEDIFNVIAIGTKNKSVGGTNQNARSSRSHCLLVVETFTKSVDGQTKNSKLNLIDLAGSEKNRNTGATGDRAKEAIKINLSLTSLNMVFMALTTPEKPGEKKYIPFKDSKLTRILKDSLGGNSLTTLLCTASKKVRYTEDTVGTLGFAQRAKKIKNDVKQNVVMGVNEYKYLVDAMKNEILVLRGDLTKAGLSYHLITDKKVLQFIPNNAVGDGSSGENQNNVQNVSNESPSIGDLSRRRRHSLINLTEDQMILKYCELKAKYDNLAESAGRKISQLYNQPSLLEENVDSEALDRYRDIIKQKDEIIDQLNNKINEEINVYKKKVESLESNFNKLNKEKIELELEKQKLIKENESTQEMLNLNFNDINELSEKLSSSKKKKKQYKSEKKKLLEEISSFSTKIDELYGKVSESEYANKVYELKIDDLNRINKSVQELLDNQIQSEKDYKEKIAKYENELNESRKSLDKLNELQNDNKTYEENFKNMKTEKDLLKQESELKSNELKDLTIKLEEIRKELSVMRTSYSKLQINYAELEAKKSVEPEKTIKNVVPMKPNSNIFGVLLKKQNNLFINSAKEESKKTDEALSVLFKDKVEELKKLRENIVSLTPKTISSRTTLEELPDIDFDDEEAFQKMQAKLAERDLQHEEEKKKKEEMEKESSGMISEI